MPVVLGARMRCRGVSLVMATCMCVRGACLAHQVTSLAHKGAERKHVDRHRQHIYKPRPLLQRLTAEEARLRAAAGPGQGGRGPDPEPTKSPTRAAARLAALQRAQATASGLLPDALGHRFLGGLGAGVQFAAGAQLAGAAGSAEPRAGLAGGAGAAAPASAGAQGWAGGVLGSRSRYSMSQRSWCEEPCSRLHAWVSCGRAKAVCCNFCPV